MKLTKYLLALALCASASAFAQAPGTTVTVQAGAIPVSDVATLFLGQEAGIFRKHGIDLKINIGTSGGALVPAVMSGEYNFAFSALVSLLQARDKGLPIRIVAAGSSSTATRGADVVMIHGNPAKGISRARDLMGKTVSVNALNGLLQLLGSIAVKEDGGDPSKVQFVELGMPDALAALKAGRIDAMVGAEPFGSAAIAAGFPVISTPYLSMSDKRILTSAYFTSEEQLKKNPALFKSIRAAINETLEYSQQHQDEVRKQLPKFTKLGPEIASRLILQYYSPVIDDASIQLFSRYAQQFGMIGKPITSADLVWNAN